MNSKQLFKFVEATKALSADHQLALQMYANDEHITRIGEAGIYLIQEAVDALQVIFENDVELSAALLEMEKEFAWK